METNSNNASATRVARIPNRIKEDLRIIKLVKNWRGFLQAKLSRVPIPQLILRNGVTLTSPDEVDLSFLFHEIWLEEIYDLDGYRLKEGDVVLDIGANIGVFAIYVATRQKDVSVFAYEPFATNVEFLRKNVSDSGIDSIQIFEKAIAGQTENRNIKVEENWVTNSISATNDDKDGLQVSCISLDDAIAKMDKCDLLKIDCEGSEYEIFYNASEETMKQIRKVACEYHYVDDETQNGDALKDFFEKNHFRVDLFEPIDDETGIIFARNTR